MQSANVAVGHVGGPGATPGISLRVYNGEEDLPDVIRLIETELSEPYNIYTYRYFLHQWPQLSYLVRERMQLPEIDRMQACAGAPAADEPRTVGVIIGKLERHMRGSRLWRGYIAMLSVDPGWRGHGIGAQLVEKLISELTRLGAEEIVLETEVDNAAAIRLYERMGFIREKRLYRFYLNNKDSFRLVLPIPQRAQGSRRPAIPPRRHIAAQKATIPE